MFKCQVRYGASIAQKSSDSPITIGSLKTDENLRLELGFGDNVKMKINGIEMSDDTIIPSGATVEVVTAANTKAN